MKIEATTLEVERSGTFHEKGFTIAANAKMFDILSSKIYTDVPLAIIRELSTNASDSHTDAGRADRPFDVHLPNALEPWLTIRDYGTGLSPENVESIYTTYAASTRSGSDDFTGCLGLGSKSPFAYTDQFTIVSNWKGTKTTYSAFKNETGCPTLARLSEVPTTEEDGLEIRIAIRPGDTSTFVKAANRVYLNFKVCPNVTGATLTLNKGTPEIETPEFSFHSRRSTHSYPGKLNVVMGQVCYAVDPNKIYNMRELGYDVTLVMHLPIGSCQIAASREEVHYDDRTIETINGAVSSAIEAARKILEKAVETEPYLLNKLMKLNRYRSLISRISINGVDVIDGAEAGKYSTISCSMQRGDKLFMHNVSDFRGGDKLPTFIEQDIGDIPQGFKNRLRAYIKANPNNHVYLIKIADQARVTELFGQVTLKLSKLPEVPRVPRNGNCTTVRSKPIKLMTEGSNDNMAFDWKSVEKASDIDPTDACCVPRDGTWAVWNGGKVRPQHVREIAQALGFKRVYGIAEKRYDAMRTKHQIPELSTVAKARAETVIASLDKYALSKVAFYPDVAHTFDYSLLKGLSVECDDFVKVIEADTSNMLMYKKLCNIFGITMPVTANYEKAFFDKYPILVAIDWYSGHNRMDAIVDYIKMIEAKGTN